MTDVHALKVALRKHVLAASKAACKQDPAWRAEQSIALCEKLLKLPLLLPLFSASQAMMSNNTNHTSASTTTMAPQQEEELSLQKQNRVKYFNVGLYMPLWFEIDVEPLTRKLLQRRQQLLLSSAAADSSPMMILPRVFVPELYPVVQQEDDDGDHSDGKTDSSSSSSSSKKQEDGTVPRRKKEMRFVEIQSEADLDENFVPVPPYNILEPPAADKDPLRERRVRIDAFATTSKSGGALPSSLVDAAAASRQRGERLDLLIVPGVAFDFGRNRLGKGGGFYDSFINATGVVAPERCIGVGFDEQLPPCSAGSKSSWWLSQNDSSGASGDKVPMASHDVALGGVVTPCHTV